MYSSVLSETTAVAVAPAGHGETKRSMGAAAEAG